MSGEVESSGRTLEEIEAHIETLLPYLPQMLALAADLVEIRDRELYKLTHQSLKAYCEERWGWSRARTDRMLAWGRELTVGTETTDDASRARRDPPTSQREAARRRKAIEATATETKPEPGQQDRGQGPDSKATLLEPTEKAELAEARKKIAQLEKALDVRLAKPDTALAAKVEALEVENQLLKAELERDDVPPVVTAEGVSADFMTQLAQALEMSVDHPPATLLAKVRSLMTERAKRKPAKKAAPEAEPEPASVTPMRPTSPFRPPAPTPSLARREVQPMFKKAR